MNCLQKIDKPAPRGDCWCAACEASRAVAPLTDFANLGRNAMRKAERAEVGIIRMGLAFDRLIAECEALSARARTEGVIVFADLERELREMIERAKATL